MTIERTQFEQDLSTRLTDEDKPRFVIHMNVLEKVLAEVLSDNEKASLDKEPKVLEMPDDVEPEDFLGAVRIAAIGRQRSFRAKLPGNSKRLFVQIQADKDSDLADLISAYKATFAHSGEVEALAA